MKRLIPFFLIALLFPSFAWASGTTTFPTCVARFDLTATNGFFYDECRDLSPWESGTTKARIIVTDSAGKTARGRVGNAGSGVTLLGTELLTNPDLEDWLGGVPVGWTENYGTAVISADTVDFTSGGTSFKAACTADKIQLKQTTVALVKGYAYSGTVDGKSSAVMGGFQGYVRDSTGAVYSYPITVFALSALNTWEQRLFTFTGAKTDAASVFIPLYHPQSITTNLWLDNYSLKRILTPGATGLYVVWDSIDAAFDYNDSTGYTVKLRAASDDDGPRSRSGRMRRGR